MTGMQELSTHTADGSASDGSTFAWIARPAEAPPAEARPAEALPAEALPAEAPPADEVPARAHWVSLLGDRHPEDISLRLLQWLRLDGTGPVLPLDGESRAVIEGHLRRAARERLGRQSVRPSTFLRTLGHPVDLPRLTFEARGEEASAAALYALVHDDLLAERSASPGLEWFALRFALVRSAVRSPLGAALEASGIADVARNRARLASAELSETDEKRELLAEMDGWLAQRRT